MLPRRSSHRFQISGLLSTSMNHIQLLFAGDFCPQLRVSELIDEERYDLIFNEFKQELDQNDFNIVDLECPLTDSTTAALKTGPHLKAKPNTVKALRFCGINVVAMANNHIRDYGQEGLLETIQVCEKEGIRTVGVGTNLDEARKPLYLEKKGVTLAVLNFTENEWSNTTGEGAGANPFSLIKNFNDIADAKRHSDFVVVVFHGGNEFYHLPSPRLKEIFRFFVDAGASAVVSHHTHVVSGFEVYKSAPIFYSLGNFCFDWPGHRNSFWNTGMAVRMRLTKGNPVTFDILPFKQNDEVAGLHSMTAKEREAFDQNLGFLNATIADDECLDRMFLKYSKEKAGIYSAYMEPYTNRLLAFLHKRGFFPSVFSERKRRLHLNIIRCESHRDLLLKALERK